MGKHRQNHSLVLLLLSFLGMPFLHGQDASTVAGLLDSAESYLRKDKDLFLEFSRKAYLHPEANQELSMKYKAAENIGYYYRTSSQYDSSAYYYLLALSLDMPDSSLYPRTYYSLGNVMKAAGLLDSAGGYYLTSLQIAESTDNIQGAAIANLGLGSLYLTQKRLEFSAKHFLGAKEFFDQAGDARGSYIATNNLGTTYFQMQVYPKAKQYFLIAQQEALKYKDIYGLSDIYSNLGIIYDQEMKLDCALYFHQQALTIRKKYELKEGTIRSYHNLVETHIRKQQYRKAQAYLDSAFALNKDLGNLSELKYYWNYKTKLDTATGRYEDAFGSLVKWQLYKDSLENVSVSNRLLELQTEYETEKKDNEIATLQQQNQIASLQLQNRNYLLGLLGLGIVLLSGGGFIFYRQQTLNREKSYLELEQRFLRSQMNPHFIFNSLTVIQNFIRENDTESSEAYMGLFGKLMRQILEHSRREFITLEDEIDTLQNYLKLQQLRFHQTFSYDIQVDEELDEEFVMIPPMFAQPFIENALEHGLFQQAGDNQIAISFRSAGDGKVRLEIQDNGVGLIETKQKNHQSLATSITRERLQKFQRKLKSKFELNIHTITSPDGASQGTFVGVTVPAQQSSI